MLSIHELIEQQASAVLLRKKAEEAKQTVPKAKALGEFKTAHQLTQAATVADNLANMAFRSQTV
jgi:hypothetical protein